MKKTDDFKLLTCLILLVFSAFSKMSHAQTTYIELIARDQISNRSINNIHVSVLSSDSAFIDTCQVFHIDVPGDPRHVHYAEVSASSPYFLLKLEKAGYKTLFVRADAQKEVYLEDIKMERAAKIRQLGEASVTASKVMMVMRGDTIVYNADAFELGEGSMLDQLIALLPGVRLEPGGVITVNGNRVNSLLINGKDFFNGDPNVALENLPAYTVDKIKAYQKAPDDAYIKRKSEKARADDPWVIDVNLKKDYNKGLLATAEAGGGLNHRYLGKFFAMRFTDRTQLFAHGNANNLNDISKAEKDGGWYNYENPPQGEMNQQKGGITFNLTGKEPRNFFQTSLTASHATTDVNSRTSAVNYLTSGNTFGRNHYLNSAEEKSVEWYANARLKFKKIFTAWEQNVNYNASSYHSDVQNATFKSEPHEERTNAVLDSLYFGKGYRQSLPLVNTYRDQSLGERKQWSVYENLYFSLALPKDKSIDGTITGFYSHDSQEAFSRYYLQTPQSTPSTDYRNRYARSPKEKYNFYGLFRYSPFQKDKDDWSQSINTAYIIRYEHSNDNKSRYRLDELGNGWELSQCHELGFLPSTTDSLAQSMDWNNTYNTINEKFEHTLSASYSLTHNGWQVFLNVPFMLGRQEADDLRKKAERNKVTKHYALLNPNLQVSGKGWTMHVNINQNMPEVNLLLPVRDDSNPLAIWHGNKDLKPSTTYKFNIIYDNRKTKHALYYKFYYKIAATRNDIRQTRLYDANTGVTVFSPVNLNGNWNTSLSADFERALDTKQHWMLRTFARCDYLKSVDFERNVRTADEQMKSVVHNTTTTGLAQIRFQSKVLNAILKTELDWRYATSHREGFTTLNSVNVLYSFITQAKLPWDIELNSDITIYTRHGYADATMNRNEWIWNASLEKRFLRNKAMSVKVKATDLLAQRRNVERTLNAQGYIETWYNTLPRYVLFTLTYRFHKAPKRTYE